jgi:hypothetical protein
MRGITLKDGSDPTLATALRFWLELTTITFADRILPFGSAEASIWGLLSARLSSRGMSPTSTHQRSGRAPFLILGRREPGQGTCHVVRGLILYKWVFRQFEANSP